MRIRPLFFTAFWNFWRITRLSTTNHRWVINAQTGSVFLAHPVVPAQKVGHSSPPPDILPPGHDIHKNKNSPYCFQNFAFVMFFTISSSNSQRGFHAEKMPCTKRFHVAGDAGVRWLRLCDRWAISAASARPLLAWGLSQVLVLRLPSRWSRVHTIHQGKPPALPTRLPPVFFCIQCALCT